MDDSKVDTAGRALLWALMHALDEHGVLTSGILRSAIADMQKAATSARDAGDEVAAQQMSDLVGQLAGYATKRNARPNVSADVHLKSFT
jgi:hypothetical protein